MAGRGGGLGTVSIYSDYLLHHGLHAYRAQVAAHLAPPTRNAGLIRARMLRLRAAFVDWRRRAGHGAGYLASEIRLAAALLRLENDRVPLSIWL